MLAETPDTKRDAITAAQHRQDRSHSLRVTLEVTRLFVDPVLAFGIGSRTSKESPMDAPPVYRNIFLLSGPSVRYEDNSYMRPFRGDQLGIQSREISVYNGLIGKRYFPEVTGSVGEQFGFMVAKGPPRNFASPFLVPLFFYNRPRDPILASIEIDECNPTQRTEQIGGHRCVGFNVIYNGRELVLWLDPERGYVPCRIARMNGTNPLWQVDVTYRPHAELGWIPQQWKMDRYTDGGPLVETWQATIREWRLGETIADDTFELTFPPNTQVQDEQTGQQYIVQNNGEWREIAPRTGKYLDEIPQQEHLRFPRYGYFIIIGFILVVLYGLNRVGGFSLASPRKRT